MLLFGTSFHRSLLCAIQKVFQFIENKVRGSSFSKKGRHR